MAYDIVVIDPPWRFASNSVARPGKNAMRHYPCMSDGELAALHLPLADPALVFCWVTAPIQWRAAGVISAWGVKPVAELVWIKDRIGTGFWARGQHELVWICKRGAFPCPRPAPFRSSLLRGRQREHSRKPEEMQDRIDEVWPDARKLEMFARRRRPGWDAWGDETERFDGEADGAGAV